VSVNTVAVADWGLDQLKKLQRTQPDLVEHALSRLIEEDAHVRWAMVISAYQDGQINLGRAAALLGMHRLELQQRLKTLGIPIRVGASDMAEAKAEAEALRTWLREHEQKP
jgi:predicted HTH domain antitoxin